MLLQTNSYILANCPAFIGEVPIYDFQNLQKSERPNFLEFQLVNISVLKYYLRHISIYLQIEKKFLLSIRIVQMNGLWISVCSAVSINMLQFALPLFFSAQ